METTSEERLPAQANDKVSWRPKNGTSWNYILSSANSIPASTTDGIDLYIIDLFDNTVETISYLHNLGKKVICYFSAGSYENWRPDKSEFHKSGMGKTLDGWPGEKWLDTNSTNVRNIMLARLDLAVQKGCDGVDPDNVDGYDNDNGLGLTPKDAINYVLFLAQAAHARGLSIGLKNAGAIIPAVIDEMEWSVNEQCVQYGECELYQPFIEKGKPVFHVEYPKGENVNDDKAVPEKVKRKICGNRGARGFSTVLKNMNLDAWVGRCDSSVVLD